MQLKMNKTLIILIGFLSIIVILISVFFIFNKEEIFSVEENKFCGFISNNIECMYPVTEYEVGSEIFYWVKLETNLDEEMLPLELSYVLENSAGKVVVQDKKVVEVPVFKDENKEEGNEVSEEKSFVYVIIGLDSSFEWESGIYNFDSEIKNVLTGQKLKVNDEIILTSSFFEPEI